MHRRSWRRAGARRSCDIVHDEDPTRPTTTAMNWSQPATARSPRAVDVIGLNYQGAGHSRSDSPAAVSAIFHAALPEQVHSRQRDRLGAQQPRRLHSSRSPARYRRAGERDRPARTSSAAGQLLRSVLRRLGSSRPTRCSRRRTGIPSSAANSSGPAGIISASRRRIDSSRSSYFGIIDLAGFKKDRFYLYQAHWRPDLPMAHILPHWTWPERVGQVTPVHVYTSGDEAELFLNGKSLGRKKKAAVRIPPALGRRGRTSRGAQGGRLQERSAVGDRRDEDRRVRRRASALTADRADDSRRWHAICIFVTVRVPDAAGLTRAARPRPSDLHHRRPRPRSSPPTTATRPA